MSSAIRSGCGFGVGDNAEAFEVNEHRAFENLVGLHRELARLEIALSEQRGDAVRNRPDMEAHELDRRALALGQLPAESGSGLLQNVEGALGGGDLFARSLRQSRLEHHRVARRLVAGEGEIGAAERAESRKRRGDAVVPGDVEAGGKAFETGARHLGEKRIAVAEMAVGRGGADPGKPRRLGQAEARGPVLLDQLARRFEQHLTQVAVVIGMRAPPAVRGTHVKSFYMKPLAAASSAL